jgi:acetyltransferase-like isoleucine patch superfamily enzyme
VQSRGAFSQEARVSAVRIFAAFRRAWLRFAFRHAGIAVVNRRLLSAPRCESLLAEFGATVGEGCVVHGPLVIYNAAHDYRNLAIGGNVHIGPLVVLDLAEALSIGDDATVSMGVTILTHADVGDRPLAERYPRAAEAPGSEPARGSGLTPLCSPVARSASRRSWAPVRW